MMDAFDIETSAATTLFEEVFKEMLPAMKALRSEEITAVNLCIPGAVATVLGVRQVLGDLKDRIVDALPEKERDLPKKLLHLALALSHAHTLYLVATRANDPVPSLAEEGMKLRSLLFSDARALVQRGFVDGEALRGYKGAVGYRNLAFDLQMLAHLFRSCPASVRDRSAARTAELQRADELAADILAGLRRRTVPDPAVEAAADTRNRAFTLFTRGYDQVRRGVVFLRWNEGDADQLVPSLYTKHHRAKEKKAATQTPEHSD
jgi:hypothetical protein